MLPRKTENTTEVNERGGGERLQTRRDEFEPRKQDGRPGGRRSQILHMTHKLYGMDGRCKRTWKVYRIWISVFCLDCKKIYITFLLPGNLNLWQKNRTFSIYFKRFFNVLFPIFLNYWHHLFNYVLWSRTYSMKRPKNELSMCWNNLGQSCRMLTLITSLYHIQSSIFKSGLKEGINMFNFDF